MIITTVSNEIKIKDYFSFIFEFCYNKKYLKSIAFSTKQYKMSGLLINHVLNIKSINWYVFILEYLCIFVCLEIFMMLKDTTIQFSCWYFWFLSCVQSHIIYDCTLFILCFYIPQWFIKICVHFHQIKLMKSNLSNKYDEKKS